MGAPSARTAPEEPESGARQASRGSGGGGCPEWSLASARGSWQLLRRDGGEGMDPLSAGPSGLPGDSRRSVRRLQQELMTLMVSGRPPDAQPVGPPATSHSSLSGLLPHLTLFARHGVKG